MKRKSLILVSILALIGIFAIWYVVTDKEEEKTIEILDLSSSKIYYEEVLLLNSWDEEDMKEIERLNIPESKYPSGAYFERLGKKGELDVAKEAKTFIFDERRIYTKAEDRKYTFETWHAFVEACKKNKNLLIDRFYVIKIKRGKVIDLKEKLIF